MTSVTHDIGGVPAWRLAMWGGIAGLLMLPLVAMRFTGEVVWTAGDFAAAAVLLVGGGALFELAVRMVPGRAGRLATGGAIAAAVMLVWLEGAVGLF